MAPNNNDTEQYILLSDVTGKCSSLAEKWNYIANKRKIENCGLEDELINRALWQQLYLYCFMPISRISGKRWFFIWSDYLKAFCNHRATVNCHLLLVNSNDRIKFDLFVDSHPRLMEVNWSDLYLNIDELKRLEDNDQDFANLVIVDPDLVGEELGNEISDMREEPNSTMQIDTREETLQITNIDQFDDTSQVKDNFESVSTSRIDLKTVAIIDSHLPLTGESVQESHPIVQAKKPKKVKQPNTKKEKPVSSNLASTVEPLILGNDDKELRPKTMAVTEESYLRLWDIIGDKKRGIKGVIPMSRQTWYTGMNDGRYPPRAETEGKNSYWKKSDIEALLNGKTDWR